MLRFVAQKEVMKTGSPSHGDDLPITYSYWSYKHHKPSQLYKFRFYIDRLIQLWLILQYLMT